MTIFTFKSCLILIACLFFISCSQNYYGAGGGRENQLGKPESAEDKKEQERLERVLSNRVRYLAEDIGERSVLKYASLNAAADYIEAELKKVGLAPRRQSFQADGKNYHNIYFIKRGSSFEKDKTGALVLGAHYDTVSGTPGADDNASAVAVLLELAGVLANKQFRRDIHFVFFTLEEPPYFASREMGSYVYASSLKEENVDVELMVCLEMLGFYSDEKIQKYPSALLKLMYPSKGNFIGVVSNRKYKSVLDRFYKILARRLDFGAEAVAAPESLQGVDFSDHRNFWRFDFPALMITDTAFYRNERYHRADDTWDTLDYPKMAMLTRALKGTIEVLANERE